MFDTDTNCQTSVLSPRPTSCQCVLRVKFRLNIGACVYEVGRQLNKIGFEKRENGVLLEDWHWPRRRRDCRDNARGTGLT